MIQPQQLQQPQQFQQPKQPLQPQQPQRLRQPRQPEQVSIEFFIISTEGALISTVGTLGIVAHFSAVFSYL